MSYSTGGWRRTEPKRRWKSLEHFRRTYFVDGGCDFGGRKRWPCLRCYGRGRVPDPGNTSVLPAEADVCEVVCPECGGSGYGPKAAVVEEYQKSVEEFKAEKREYAQLVKARQEALDILNPIQVQGLKELGI